VISANKGASPFWALDFIIASLKISPQELFDILSGPLRGVQRTLTFGQPNEATEPEDLFSLAYIGAYYFKQAQSIDLTLL
jgi:hypothetical protein